MSMRNALALALVAGVASFAQADLVAYWDFNDSQTGVGGVLGVLNAGGFNAQQGSGSLTTNVAINTNNVTPNGTIGTFAGTTVNLLAPSGSGGGLAIQNGSGGVNNGKWVQFNVSTTGFFSNLVMTYASQRTGTGFTAQDVSFSTDGGATFTALTTVIGLPSSYGLQTVNFGAADVYNKASLAVRFTFSGGSTTAASGNNRIDNLQINGVTPAPGAIALLGLGGLVAGRRRRA